MDKDSKSNLLYIDGLRAFAALYVILHHAVLQYYNFDTHGLKGVRLTAVNILLQGNLSVDLFIVISGFCLMRPLINAGYKFKGGVLTFYKKRIIRILPPYYLAMLLSIVLIYLFIGQPIGTHWDISIPISYKDIIAHVLLIQDFFLYHTFKINHAFWSISVESRIYIIFPAIIYLWSRLGVKISIFISVIFSCAGYFCLLFLRNLPLPVNMFSPGVTPYIILFVLGMLAAEYSSIVVNKSLWKIKISWPVLFVGSLILFAIIKKLIVRENIKPDQILFENINISFGLCCFFLLVVCSKPMENKVSLAIKAAFSWQPLVFLGSFAYSIYLVHAPLIQLLTQYLVNPLNLTRFNSAIMLFVLTPVFVLPLSYLFFIACEKPFITSGKKLSIKNLEIAAAINPAP